MSRVATVSADSIWQDKQPPEKGSDVPVYVTSSQYRDGVKLEFGDCFNVTVTPDQAMELGKTLIALGGYLRIFDARFGIPEAEAKVVRRISP